MKNKVFKRLMIIVGCLITLWVVVVIGTDLIAKNEIGKVTIQDINTSSLQDGNYDGEAIVGPVTVKLTVKIVDKRIDEILILEHVNALGKKAEMILDEIIMNQSIDIDSISGATTSSVCIKKAIENAVKGK